jgi:hypothetical protein
MKMKEDASAEKGVRLRVEAIEWILIMKRGEMLSSRKVNLGGSIKESREDASDASLQS